MSAERECEWCYRRIDTRYGDADEVRFRGLSWVVHRDECKDALIHDLLDERGARDYPEPLVFEVTG